MVVDDFHHAGRQGDAPDIDDELVEPVRQNDHLFLVVATRTSRVLETTGSLSIDVTVISPRELRLGPAGVAALAARTGVAIGEAQAARLSVGFGGWPAAIRDVLVRSRGDGGRINLALADQYIATMVRDLRHEAVRSFMLRTAVPDEFDAESSPDASPRTSACWRSCATCARPACCARRSATSGGCTPTRRSCGRRSYGCSPRAGRTTARGARHAHGLAPEHR